MIQAIRQMLGHTNLPHMWARLNNKRRIERKRIDGRVKLARGRDYI